MKENFLKRLGGLRLLVLLILLAALPLTVFIAQKQQEIRQRADDDEGLPKGFLDNADCNNFSGWTCSSDYDRNNSPLLVYFYDDGPANHGIFIASTTADREREQAVGNECGGTRNHGFNFATPDSVKDGQNHTIYAYGVSYYNLAKYSLLSNSPKTINCSPPPTLTPTPTPTPIPTPSATPTPTVSPTPTPTGPASTVTPSTTVTPSPGGAQLSLTVTLPGINGDVNSVLLRPRNPQKKFIVELFDSGNKALPPITSPLYLDRGDKDSATFAGNVDLGTSVPAGNYIIKVKTNKFLRKLIPGFKTITANTVITLPAITLISGDINNDNVMNIIDYNILASCFGEKMNSASCGNNKENADLNEDGKVDGVDYSGIFLRNIQNKQGD